MSRYNDDDSSSYMFIWIMWFIIMMMILWGCSSDNNTDLRPMSELHWSYGHPVQVAKYDGCEYVFFPCGNSSWGSHKGNCSNPIHQYNKNKNFNLTLNGNRYRIDSMNVTGKIITFYTDSTQWIYKTK